MHNLSSTGLLLLIAMGLTACGGGGNTSTVTLDKGNSSSEPTTEETNDSSGNEDDDENTPEREIVEKVKVEAEDFVDYSDVDSANKGSANYRTDEGVDLESVDGDNYAVGYTAVGEWVEYTIDLSQGVYDFSVSYASEQNMEFSLSLKGKVVDTYYLSATSGWQDYTTEIFKGIATDAGEQTLRLTFISGEFNLDWFQFDYDEDASTAMGDDDGEETNNDPQEANNNQEVAIDGGFLVGGADSSQPGYALYVFDNDQDQSGSTCNGSCATNWPPLLVSDDLPSGASGLTAVERDNGDMQVAYQGRPLYFYKNDNEVGDTSGDAVGGVWWLAEQKQVEVSLGDIKPLYNANTDLEIPHQEMVNGALVTRFSDRGRDRHAKENHFQAYDHFLTFYWENRTISVEIVDEVATGGDTITMNVKSYGKLDFDQAENRWLYAGRNTLAEYCDNRRMMEVVELRDEANEIFHYTREGNYNCREGRPFQVGDSLEFEISQFLDKAVLKRGRDNYYGTTYLYIVGQGLVPWDTYQTGQFQEGVPTVDFNGQQVRQRDSKMIPEKAWLGGGTTLHALETAEPDGHFMQLATNIGYDNGQLFVLGRRVHHTSFTDGTHNESDENGIWEEMKEMSGPNYINDRCVDCHVRNGAAEAPELGQTLDQYVVKAGNADGSPHDDYGRVIQPVAGVGGSGEGNVSIASWTENNGLRSPNYAFSNGAPEQYSARVTPRLVGLGLLEAIPEADILALADENDADNDGISGKAAIAVDPVTGDTRLGRFGWKAGATSIKHQVAGAFNTDMGVMTSVLPDPDCGANQTCNNNRRLADEHLDNLVKYVALLGVRPQRDYDDSDVMRGQEIFEEINCTGCHTQSFQTSEYHPFAALRDQKIMPYTDMLLHDMGAGLADNLGEGNATGAEWRTTPLWGLGNQACVMGGVTGVPGGSAFGTDGGETCTPRHSYLHDGRARTIEEAILWHGGEGEESKDDYEDLSASDKEKVLKFLNSL